GLGAVHGRLRRLALLPDAQELVVVPHPALRVAGKAAGRVKRGGLAAGVDRLADEPAVVQVARAGAHRTPDSVRHGQGDDLVMVVRPADVGLPPDSVLVVHVDRREPDLNTAVTRLADVLQRLAVTGGLREGALQQEVAGILPVPVDGAVMRLSSAPNSTPRSVCAVFSH